MMRPSNGSVSCCVNEESAYSQADFTINTDVRAHADVAQDIVNAWHTVRRSPER